MLSPKEKAEELVDKFCGLNRKPIAPNAYSATEDCYHDYHQDLMMWRTIHLPEAKNNALICVDEIINSSPSLPLLSNNGTYGSDIEENAVYWQEVKQEILNL